MLRKTGLSSTAMRVLRSALTSASALRSSDAATLARTSFSRPSAALVSSDRGILIGRASRWRIGRGQRDFRLLWLLSSRHQGTQLPPPGPRRRCWPGEEPPPPASTSRQVETALPLCRPHRRYEEASQRSRSTHLSLSSGVLASGGVCPWIHRSCPLHTSPKAKLSCGEASQY